jgi:RimJ/RimL family protein N-acetyltransferase
MNAHNSFGQPIGPSLGAWSAPPVPARETLTGRYCRVEPLDAARHGERLFEAFAEDTEGRSWTYMAAGPFAERSAFADWLARCERSADPLFFAIVRKGAAVGLCSYLRIAAPSGCLEVGHLSFSPRLQRTRAATEAMYLMMRHAFELGYRRYEWKCDALNAPSRAAAQRLGFSFEGVFRQATVYKGRSRDTAWYSVIDKEWPALREALERWLAPENFDARGQQRVRLSELTAAVEKVAVPG